MKKFRFFALSLALLLLVIPLLPVQAAQEDMYIEGKAAILIDAVYGDVLYAQNADDRVYPASTTKIMTGLLVVEAVEMGGLSLDSVVTATAEAIAPIPLRSSHQSIQPGENLSVEELLYCLMVASANDAANVLAEAVGGNIESFVNLMNQKAEALGLSGTHFVNAHGLHDDNHYTTARDLARLAQYAMSHATFREVVATAVYTVPATNMSAERVLHTSNYLLSHRIIPGYVYANATGIKTGTTDEAGYCLVSSGRKGDRELIAVVMGTELKRDAEGLVTDRMYLSESKRLLEWGFSDYTRREILSTTELIGELPVTLSTVADYVVAQPEAGIEATIARSMDLAEFERTVVWEAESLEAPITKGQVMGTISLRYNDRDYGTVNLVALNDVEASAWKVFWKDTGRAILSIVLAVIFIIIAAFILVLVIRNHRRNKKIAARKKERQEAK